MSDDVFGHLLRHTVSRCHTQGLEDLTEDACHSRLTRARVTCQDEVILGKTLGSLAHLNELFLYSYLLGDATHGVLHTLHTYKAVELLHDVVDRDLLGSILAHNVGIGQHIVSSVAQTLALHSEVEEVAHLTGITEGVAALEIHLVENLGQHLFCLGIKGKLRSLIVAQQHVTEQRLQFTGRIVREFNSDIAA